MGVLNTSGGLLRSAMSRRLHAHGCDLQNVLCKFGKQRTLLSLVETLNEESISNEQFNDAIVGVGDDRKVCGQSCAMLNSGRVSAEREHMASTCFEESFRNGIEMACQAFA